MAKPKKKPRNQPPKRPPQPHDRMFGLVFGDKAHAGPYLQAVLPKHISERIDFSRLKAVPAKILTDELGMTESDVLFTAPLDNGTLCYLQIEQQTSGDEFIIFRMLDYASDIGQQHMRQHKGAGLPAVAQVILYNGKESWKHALRIRDLITDKNKITGKDNAEDVTRLGLVAEFAITKLDPLNRVSAEELRGRGLTPPGVVTLALMKIAPRSATLDVELRHWADEIRAVLALTHRVRSSGPW